MSLSNRSMPPVSGNRPSIRRDPPRSEDDLRAIKRALIHAPLGPRAAEALASAAIELEERLSRRHWNRVPAVERARESAAEAARSASQEDAGPARRG